MGRDHTIYSLVDGYVRFDFSSKNKRRVNVDPIKGSTYEKELHPKYNEQTK